MPPNIFCSDPWGVSLGTLDANGSIDAVLACDQGPWGSGCATVLLHNATGMFPTKKDVRTWRADVGDGFPRPRFVKLADMNQDCRNDIVASTGRALTIMLNLTPPPATCNLAGAGGSMFSGESQSGESDQQKSSESDPEECGDDDGYFWNDSLGFFEWGF